MATERQYLKHFGNPALRWMLSSTVVKTDPAGNIKPDKEKSVHKIDGIVASIMALGEWMTAQGDEMRIPTRTGECCHWEAEFMIRRKVSEEQVRQREPLASELGAIPALNPAARKLLSAEGFLDYFLEARMLFPTYEDAYYFLEEQHERLTGEWMYSEYDSFRAVYKRWLKRQKKESRSSP